MEMAMNNSHQKLDFELMIEFRQRNKDFRVATCQKRMLIKYAHPSWIYKQWTAQRAQLTALYATFFIAYFLTCICDLTSKNT